MNGRTLVKRVIPKHIFRQVEPYGHWVEAVIAQNKYHFPARNLKVIGVTGTDGKTTTCNLIASMLRSNGKKVAVITTVSVDFGDGKGEQINPTALTTGSAAQLNSLISKVIRHDVEWLVLEVSSHALNQRRVWGIPFTIAVMTNMSPEHLDYHGTFEKYREAKERLFKLCAANKQGMQTGIINADDKTSPYFKRDVPKSLTYGFTKGDLRPRNATSTLDGNAYDVDINGTITRIESSLVGEFNIYNTLAAVGVGQTIGFSPTEIKKGIQSLKYVPGRMMPIEEGQDFKVFIDYAVTPAALERVLTTTRNLSKKGKVHIVFGATGDRDTQKRPKMGEVTSRLADKVYLTDDETYTEDPASIQAAVLKGVRTENKSKVEQFTEREEAIRAALTSAKPNDTVIISGIGHQSSRNMGGSKQAWSDIEVTTKVLKALK